MEVTITIPEALASKAKAGGLSPETYIEKLLDRVAAASADQARERERLREELSADWQHYLETGLHLDEDEVDAWLGALEEGKSEEPPALHR